MPSLNKESSKNFAYWHFLFVFCECLMQVIEVRTKPWKSKNAKAILPSEWNVSVSWYMGQFLFIIIATFLPSKCNHIYSLHSDIYNVLHKKMQLSWWVVSSKCLNIWMNLAITNFISLAWLISYLRASTYFSEYEIQLLASSLNCRKSAELQNCERLTDYFRCEVHS